MNGVQLFNPSQSSSTMIHQRPLLSTRRKPGCSYHLRLSEHRINTHSSRCEVYHLLSYEKYYYGGGGIFLDLL